MAIGVILLLICVGVLVFLTQSKIDFIKNRAGCEKIVAEVMEYRKEKSPMRNDYTMLEYSYVKINSGSDGYILRKLRYAHNWGRSFKIGEFVDVFWLGGDLLYWNAFNNGVYKYLPEK